jgi:hypothetical protein
MAWLEQWRHLCCSTGFFLFFFSFYNRYIILVMNSIYFSFYIIFDNHVGVVYLVILGKCFLEHIYKSLCIIIEAVWLKGAEQDDNFVDG